MPARLKTLALGAKPRAGYKGPWIDISDSESWEYLPRTDLQERVVIEVLPSATRIPLNGSRILLSGTQARVVVDIDAGSEPLCIQLREFQ